MWDTLNSSFAARILAGQELFELVRGHVDVCDHIALAQRAQISSGNRPLE